MTNSNSKNLQKILSIICLTLICFSSMLFAGCSTGAETGLSLQQTFQVSYTKNQEIEVYAGNGKTELSTIVPNLTGGVLIYNYLENGAGEVKSDTIDMVEAYQNFVDKKTGVYKLEIKGFSTSLSSDKKETKTMTLYLYTKNSSETQELQVKYTIYPDTEAVQGAETVTKILTTMNYVCRSILSPLIGVMCAVGTIYAIYLGIKMARANNSDQRDEAKKHVVGCVVAILIGIALIILFNLFASSSLVWFGADEGAGGFFNTFLIK